MSPDNETTPNDKLSETRPPAAEPAPPAWSAKPIHQLRNHLATILNAVSLLTEDEGLATQHRRLAQVAHTATAQAIAVLDRLPNET